MVDRRCTFGPVGWCLAAALLFGASTPAAKPLVDDMGPLLLSGVLYWGAALAVSPAAFRHWRRHPRAAWWARLFLLGGLSLAPAGSVSLWLTLETVATAVLARLFFREHLGLRGWLATGLVISASAGLAEPGLGGAKAAGLVGIACMAWGLDNNFTSVIDGYSTAEITWFKGVCAGLITLPTGWLSGGHASAIQLFSALLIGALGCGAALVLYVAGAQQLGATRSHRCLSTAPLFGLAVAFAFWLSDHSS